MVDTNDEWIRSRTGIEERRILKSWAKPLDIASSTCRAGDTQKENLDPKEIDCIICATVTPDMVFPSTANIIADKVARPMGMGL